jgi:hypothetical protein
MHYEAIRKNLRKRLRVTLVEALKTGKRIRNLTVFNSVSRKQFFLPSLDEIYFYEDILSTDWQIEPDAKPRMLAWKDDQGFLYTFKDGWNPNGNIGVAVFTRVPHLDEPEK